MSSSHENAQASTSQSDAAILSILSMHDKVASELDPTFTPPPPKPKIRKAGEKNEEGKILYCKCRSDRSDQFMISCDNCNEWFHGPCVNIEESFAKNVEQYHCDDCVNENSSLEKFIYKKKYLKKLERQKAEEESLAGIKCGKCIGCVRIAPCGKCPSCINDGSLEKCVLVKCVQADMMMRKVGRPRRSEVKTEEESDDGYPPPQPSTVSVPDEPLKRKRGRKKGWRKDQQILTKTETRVKEEVDSDSEKPQNTPPCSMSEFTRSLYSSYTSARTRRSKKITAAKVEPPRQCYEPDCIRQAREGSKYCSDECGRKLARKRLLQILPGRVDEFWKKVPNAEVRAQVQLSELNHELRDLDTLAHKLKHCTSMLERLVASLKVLQPLDFDESGENDNVRVGNCTVCGSEVAARQLPKHLERCFVKSEKQITFGTSAKSAVNPDRLFCDVFNKVSNTYCKRIRVMCAEHYDHELEGQMSVCGFPKAWQPDIAKSTDVDELFRELDPQLILDKGFCCNPTKECTTHLKWLQTIYGTLECERYNVLIKIEEVHNRINCIRMGNAYRGDVITLLCSRTEEAGLQDEPMCT